jgi:nucleotide-binding universal stress UspA family protein
MGTNAALCGVLARRVGQRSTPEQKEAGTTIARLRSGGGAMAGTQPEGNPAIRRILACFDGSGLGERSLPHAVAVAGALGAPLTLLRVLECPANQHVPPDPIQWEIRRREARDYMGQLAGRCQAESAHVDAEVIEGKAAEEICRWSAERDVDLTVVTTHGAGGHSPWALASTARKLLDRAPGSFLIVPATVPPSEGVARYRRVLVPLDGSPLAETALPIAERVAAAQGSELIIAHVVPIPELTQIGPLEAEDVELKDRLRRRNERVARGYLDRLRAQLSGERAKLRVILLQGGDVASRLAGVAQREHIDLIVLAAHGQTGRLHMPCGGVTAELIARTPVPVLVVRSRATRSMQRVVPIEPAAVRLPQHAAS